MTTETKRLLTLTDEQYRILCNLVDNADRMAGEYLEGRHPGSPAEQKALIYKLTLERIQDALRDA
jgi:hypothetical protein